MFTRLARPAALALVAGGGLVVPATAQCTEVVNVTINGFHNPFLAGQPSGTQIGADQAPAQSPYKVPLSLSGLELLRFLDVTGEVNNAAVVAQKFGAKQLTVGPDGDPSVIASSSEAFGISSFRMPVSAMLGVFLPDSTNSGGAPMRLDFSTPASRDFDVLSPELYQIFFIGDGYREDGLSVQAFVVPAGASRVFLGTADPSSWSNNSGSLSMTVEQEVADITPYCDSKLSSQGCLPLIGYNGYPTFSGTHSFDIVCSGITPGMRGTLFYGRAPKNDPFQGGTLCTNVMIKRTPITSAPPSQSGAVCSSAFTFDFNAWIQSGNDPSLMPGTIIFAQWWMRDSGAFSKTGLSDALQIQLCQ